MTIETAPLAFDVARAERELALREARRGLIMKAAWTVFARDGLDGATMRAIAQAAGCTTGAIYPVFPSKEAIYAALLGESLDRLRAGVAAAVEQASSDADRLRQLAAAFLAYYRERPEEIALGLYLWNGIGPRGLSREIDRDLNGRLLRTLALAEQAFVGLGAGDPQGETAALFAFLIGALVVQQTGRLRTLRSSLDDVAARHMARLIGALEARPAQPAGA